MKNKRPEETGRVNENIIESLLTSYRYKKTTTKEMDNILKNTSLTTNKEKRYCKHFPVDGLYQRLQRYEEFFVHGSPAYPDGLLITAKRQDSHGSVHEKASYMIINAKQYHKYPTMIIFDGDMSDNGVFGASCYLREQVKGDRRCCGLFGECPNRRELKTIVGVFTFNEFQKWVNDGGL